jgi:hypothetical protein
MCILMYPRWVSKQYSIAEAGRLKSKRAGFGDAFRAFREAFPQPSSGIGHKYFKALRDRSKDR